MNYIYIIRIRTNKRQTRVNVEEYCAYLCGVHVCTTYRNAWNNKMCYKKIIDDKKSTITWYAADNKISHVNSKAVDGILDTIKKHFGKLVTTRGNTHEFLEMKIHITDDKKIEISTKDQIEEAFHMFI